MSHIINDALKVRPDLSYDPVTKTWRLVMASGDQGIRRDKDGHKWLDLTFSDSLCRQLGRKYVADCIWSPIITRMDQSKTRQ